jgi:predicted Zn finger-like uncharacterized protein
MRIVCPFCSAAYDVPEDLLVGRQAVRCARCAQEWQPDLPALADPQPAPDQEVVTRLDAPQPPPRLRAGAALPMRRDMTGDWAIDRLMAAPQPPPRGRLALAAAWTASVIVVLGVLAAGYVWRAEIMAAWPPSARLYATFGLADDSR